MVAASVKPWREQPCIEWWKSRKPSGHGQQMVRTGQGRQPMHAHRLIYEECFGPILAGLDIDHLCRNPSCVNPLHLEAVSRRVNVLRGKGPTAINAAKTHCVRGHLFTPENTIWRRGGKHRECRACTRIHTRHYRERNRK